MVFKMGKTINGGNNWGKKNPPVISKLLMKSKSM